MAMIEHDWLEQIEKSELCTNCGAEIDTQFCGQCGQKKLTHRLRFGELIGELFSRIFNHERGLFFTLGQLLVAPGSVIRNYVSGKQKPYVSPLTIFFIGATAVLLSIWYYEPFLRESMNLQMQSSASAEDLARLEKAFDGRPAEVLADSYLNAMQQGYTYLALLTFCLPLAVFLWLSQRLTGLRFQLAETLVFSLYVTGMVLLITATCGMLTIRMGGGWHIGMALTVYSGYPLWAQRGFFKSGWFPGLLTLLSTWASIALFFLSIIAVFAAAVFVKLLW